MFCFFSNRITRKRSPHTSVINFQEPPPPPPSPTNVPSVTSHSTARQVSESAPVLVGEGGVPLFDVQRLPSVGSKRQQPEDTLWSPSLWLAGSGTWSQPAAPCALRFLSGASLSGMGPPQDPEDISPSKSPAQAGLSLTAEPTKADCMGLKVQVGPSLSCGPPLLLRKFSNIP